MNRHLRISEGLSCAQFLCPAGLSREGRKKADTACPAQPEPMTLASSDWWWEGVTHCATSMLLAGSLPEQMHPLIKAERWVKKWSPDPPQPFPKITEQSETLAWLICLVAKRVATNQP